MIFLVVRMLYIFLNVPIRVQAYNRLCTHNSLPVDLMNLRPCESWLVARLFPAILYSDDISVFIFERLCFPCFLHVLYHPATCFNSVFVSYNSSQQLEKSFYIRGHSSFYMHEHLLNMESVQGYITCIRPCVDTDTDLYAIVFKDFALGFVHNVRFVSHVLVIGPCNI